MNYSSNPEKIFYHCKLLQDFFESPINFSQFIQFSIIESYPSLGGFSVWSAILEKYPWISRLSFWDFSWQEKIFYSINFMIDKIIIIGIIFAIVFCIFWIGKKFWQFLKKQWW